jgi:aminopeptidase N
VSRSRLIVAVVLGLALLTAAACSGDEPEARPSATSTTSTSSTTTTTTLVGSPGDAGLGDRLTPLAGNGGYDVDHYRLELDATRPNGELVGTATIDATATQPLSSFNLDLSGFTVDDVTVDATDAPHDRFGTELRVTPGEPIDDGDSFSTVVRYHGVPGPVPDPSAPGQIGWLTGDSGTFVVAEPTGAMGVFPGNDHPSDKATFDIVVTAPSASTVVANGVQTDRVDAGGATTWTFDVPEPMAPYLLQVAIGQYRVVTGATPAGLPLRSAAPATRTGIDLDLIHRRMSDQLAWFEPQFGPYPFDVYGVLIADAPPTFALETQTISIFPTSWYLAGDRMPVESIEAHELAHQWFGNSVSLEQWNDIWLNEGLATYAEWMWNDHKGWVPLAASVQVTMQDAAELRQRYGPVAAPRSGELFSPNQYEGAALVVHALRKTVGDEAFFTILRTWTERYAGESATTADFEALASEISGQDLTAFFAAWLHSDTLPPMPA